MIVLRAWLSLCECVFHCAHSFCMAYLNSAMDFTSSKPDERIMHSFLQGNSNFFYNATIAALNSISFLFYFWIITFTQQRERRIQFSWFRLSEFVRMISMDTKSPRFHVYVGSTKCFTHGYVTHKFILANMCVHVTSLWAPQTHTHWIREHTLNLKRK